MDNNNNIKLRVHRKEAKIMNIENKLKVQLILN